MSFDDPIESASKGAVKGFLEFSKKEIASFIQKLKERKLAFIEEQKTIEIAKEQYHSD